MSEFDYRELRGLIRSKFGTQENYAKAIGISNTSLQERLSNKVPFKQTEIIMTKQLLGLSAEKMDETFFTLK